MDDFFIDIVDAQNPENPSQSVSAGPAPSSTVGGPATDGSDTELDRTFTAIRGMIREDAVKSIKAVYMFDLKGRLLVANFFISNAHQLC